MKQFRLEKSKPGIIQYRCDFESEFSVYEIPGHFRTRRSAQTGMEGLARACSVPIPVPLRKLKDLIELCDKNIVKREHQGFYRALAAGEDNPGEGLGLGADELESESDSEGSEWDAEDELPLQQYSVE